MKSFLKSCFKSLKTLLGNACLSLQPGFFCVSTHKYWVSAPVFRSLPSSDPHAYAAEPEKERGGDQLGWACRDLNHHGHGGDSTSWSAMSCGHRAGQASSHIPESQWRNKPGQCYLASWVGGEIPYPLWSGSRIGDGKPGDWMSHHRQPRTKNCPTSQMDTDPSSSSGVCRERGWVWEGRQWQLPSLPPSLLRVWKRSLGRQRGCLGAGRPGYWLSCHNLRFAAAAL